MNQTLIGFIKKELIQTLRDPRMKFLLFVTPIIQMTLFGVAVSNEVKNIRLAAFYQSTDTVARDVYDRAIAGKWFLPVRVSSVDRPFELIRSGRADAVLVAPPGGFTRAIERGEAIGDINKNGKANGAPLQLLTDATNVLQAQAVESYLRTIINSTIKDDLHVTIPKAPIQTEIRVLYNPALDTSIFMVPGVMCTLMVMTTMMLSMVAIVREKEMGTFEALISAPVSPSEVIYGKTIPYVVLGMINLPLILSVALLIFRVPMRGSYIVLTFCTFVFICTSVGIGTLLSTFCKNQQQSALGSFLFMFPAMMFSGLMFPLENMPPAIRWVAYLDPLSHYMGLLRNIMLKGGGAAYVVTHTLALAAMAALCIYVSFRRFRTTLQ